MLIMRSTPEAEEAMENVDFNEVIAAMGRYNEELIKAGVLLAGEGLTGPEEGFVVDFDSDPPVSPTAPTPRPRSCSTASGSSRCRRWKRPSSGRCKCRWARGVKLEVRRVSETEEFPQDNEWVQKEIQWRGGPR